MITDRFGALIEELGTVLRVKLTPDSNGACLIRFKDQLGVYLELDSLGEGVQIMVEIGKAGEGKFRENILREALRANGLPPPRTGIFCYSQKKDSLLLYEPLPIEDLTGGRLAEVITQISEKARLWRDSIARGELPPFRSTVGRSTSSGFMGLR